MGENEGEDGRRRFMKNAYLSLALACALTGCNKPTPPPAAATPLPPPTCSPAPLTAQIKDIARAAQGKVGVAALVLEGDEAIGVNGTDQFPMQSVYKLPIGMYVLHQVEQGKLSLDQKVKVSPKDFLTGRQHSPIRDQNPKGIELSVRELLRFMVSESDGTACDVLLKLVGGPAEVTKYLRELHVEQIMVANTERELGNDESLQYANWASPESALKLLGLVHEGSSLSPASRSLLLDFMTRSPTGPRRIKAGLPPGTALAHKTGSSGRVAGFTRALNDIGIVTLPDGRHLALAVFISDSKVDEAILEKVIADIARHVWDCVTQAPTN